MVLGVTGNIGSGKSTVAAIFAELGGVLVDADLVAKEAVDYYPEFRDWLRTRFGTGIFEGETLLRRKLGQIVFNDPVAKNDLDENIKPYISRLLAEKIDNILRSKKVAVIDATMIYEWKNENNYDTIVVVAAEPESAIKRAALRLKISEEEVRARYKSQIPIEEKIKKADFVIYNNSNLDMLRSSAMETWEKIKINL